MMFLLYLYIYINSAYVNKYLYTVLLGMYRGNTYNKYNF